MRFRFLLILLFSFLVSPLYAGSCTWSWTATITDEDRYNSAGKKLLTLGQVLAQDRYLYWVQQLPDQIDKIKSDNYWVPKGIEKTAKFYSKRNRQILTEIQESAFNILQSDREQFWNCPKAKIHVVKSGWDCDAEATSYVDIDVTSCE